MHATSIPCVTHLDAEKLSRVVEDLLRRSDALEHGAEALHDALDAARIVPAQGVPADVVTMNSRAVIDDAGGGAPRSVRLVYPEHADPARGDVSVLSPLGNALLGARIGDHVTVRTPAGARVVRVTGIEFQPEAAGRYDL